MSTESLVVSSARGAAATFVSCTGSSVGVDKELVEDDEDDEDDDEDEDEDDEEDDVDVDVTSSDVVVVLSVVACAAAAAAAAVAWALPLLALAVAGFAPGFGTAVHLLPLMLVMNWPLARLALVAMFSQLRSGSGRRREGGGRDEAIPLVRMSMVWWMAVSRRAGCRGQSMSAEREQENGTQKMRHQAIPVARERRKKKERGLAGQCSVEHDHEKMTAENGCRRKKKGSRNESLSKTGETKRDTFQASGRLEGGLVAREGGEQKRRRSERDRAEMEGRDSLRQNEIEGG